MEIENILPNNFSNESKVWIFQSKQIIPDDNINKIETIIQDFVKNWQSHQFPVKGFASIFLKKFIIFAADENLNTVGGCSTDGLFRCLQSIEQSFNLNFFDRQQLCFYMNGALNCIQFTDLNIALEKKIIFLDSLYFNNATVTTKNQLVHKWLVPLFQSGLIKI